MKKEYTILHISDLHKSSKDKYENLLASLCVDCGNYTSSGIPKPEIIVVSGDLIEGSRNEDIKEAEHEIRNQYEEVTVFLNKLVDSFLDGDKRRIIIVPGNHDVFRGISLKAMKPEGISDSKSIKSKREELNRGKVRWNWNDLSFYSIEDNAQYESRFDLFLNFYNSFYKYLDPPRIWDKPCEQNSQLIDLPDYNICFLCLNSCHKLDHLNDSGLICPNALTMHQPSLNKIHKRGSLIVGVWHHHTLGLPLESNYLDYRILKALIGHKVQLGLYGHQHMSSILNEYNDLTQEKKIYLISSGSLYGSRKQLQTGIPRQYCLITLKFEEEKAQMELRVRKDTATYDIPNWNEAQIGDSASTTFSRELPLCPLRIEDFIELIENRVQTSRNYERGWLEMYELRRSIPNHELIQKYLDKYISKIEDPDFIISNITDPRSDTEYIHLLNSYLRKKDNDNIKRLISDYRFKTLQGGFINFLREEISKIL